MNKLGSKLPFTLFLGYFSFQPIDWTAVLSATTAVVGDSLPHLPFDFMGCRRVQEKKLYIVSCTLSVNQLHRQFSPIKSVPAFKNVSWRRWSVSDIFGTALWCVSEHLRLCISDLCHMWPPPPQKKELTIKIKLLPGRSQHLIWIWKKQWQFPVSKCVCADVCVFYLLCVWECQQELQSHRGE